METNNLDVVKSFLQALFSSNAAQAAQSLAENLSVENLFPHKGNKKAFTLTLQQLLKAMSDVKYEICNAQSAGVLATITFQVSGIHSEPLDLPLKTLQVVQPSHKRISWPTSQWEFTIADGKIVRIRNVAALDKGMPGILRSFGVSSSMGHHHIGDFLKHFGIDRAGGDGSMKNKESFRRFIPLIPMSIMFTVIFIVQSPIIPVAWTPQPSQAWTGALAPNEALLKAEFISQGKLNHPEDVAFDAEGRLYTGCEDGNIYRLTLDASGKVTTFETFAKVGGYPLGLHFDKAGNLIAAVKGVGLLSLDTGGNETVLTNEANNTPITYANDLDITGDGTIYFSDSSVKFNRGWPYDILEGKPYGRLLAYDPNTMETRIIKEGLYFANGVALAPDESFLLVGETPRYRIARYWLKGPKSGTWDYFAENLPILVDNIVRDENGSYFVAGNRRLAFIDTLQPKPFIKKQVAKIPFNVLKAIPALKRNRYGLILVLNQNGDIVQSLQDPTGRVYATSSAHPYKGYLYIGTLYGDDIARYPLKP